MAPNAFKGSLTAIEAAIAMVTSIRRILPNVEVVQVPVADGGDGFSSGLALDMVGVNRQTRH